MLWASPPSRAAWIEIIVSYILIFSVMSPPSRAAWIEIKLKDSSDLAETVAAFTGGVD